MHQYRHHMVLIGMTDCTAAVRNGGIRRPEVLQARRHIILAWTVMDTWGLSAGVVANETPGELLGGQSIGLWAVG
jgi:hypothetical protein